MIDAMREHLLAMRAEELGRVIRDGRAPLLAVIETALARLNEIPAEAHPSSRAVVSDDGRTIRLALYADTGAVAAVVLDPVYAIGLANRLLAAALSRLQRG
jgi:hypothetical protein